MPPYNYCAVDGCKSQKSNRNLSFFSLPVNEVRRKRWLQVIGRPDLDNPKTNPKCYFVCSLHFEKYMVTSKPILKLDAEPIKFLPNQPNSYNDTEEHKDASTQTDYVNGLSEFADGLHAFPEVPIVKQENIEDEAIFQSMDMQNNLTTIKLENIEYETETNHEELIHFQNPHTPAKKMRGKTKEPRKARKNKPRQNLKRSGHRKSSS